MKCGIITPIGPGHADLAKEADSSISDAISYSKGAFDEIEWYAIEDLAGDLGRSKARNNAIANARASGCNWLFFLDADDLLAKDAFETVAPYLNDYDAIWGSIKEQGDSSAALRDSQVMRIDTYAELIAHDPYLTLQMGHFVRASCLGDSPFDEEMNTGEDFKYYLPLWKSHRCVKIPAPLFINRRGYHSTGPRSATGREWGVVAREMIEKARQELAGDQPASSPANGDNKANQPRPKEEQPFRYVYSEGLGELFEQLNITLLVTTYQAGKLCTFRATDGQIKMLPRTFKKAMGVAADRSRMAIATQHEIWFLQNETVIAPKVEPRNTYDACYIPRRCHVTSNIDLHEVAWGTDDLWLVNTLFSCLATIDNRSSFVPRWHPPFVSGLSRHDRCHLNGLAMLDGHPAYVTMFAETDSPQGWRDHKLKGGIVMHVGSGEVVARGLSMPHSPRVHGGQLWVLDSGNGRLACVDPQNGHIEPVVQFDSYTRGLAFCGCYAFVGLSKIREKKIFGGVPIADESRERRCGVAVVDLRRGEIVDRLEFERSVEEIFDVQVLEGIRFPTVVGFDQDTIERAALIETLQPISKFPAQRLPVSDKAAASAKITEGLRYLRADFKERAATCFRKAVQLAPNYPRALNNLGYVLLELDDVQGAIDCCQQAVRFDPDYPLAHNNLGNAYRANTEHQRARTQYEMAIRLRPDYAQALHNLGVVLIDLGKPEAAKAPLRQALKLQPDLAVTWNRLATAQARTGEFDQAMASHNRAIEAEPENSRLKADRASALADSGKLQEAIDSYYTLLVDDPDNLDDRKDLAMVLLKKGDYEAGWQEYDSRLNAVRTDRIKVTPEGEQMRVSTPLPTTPRCADFPQPRWAGEPLEGRNILIWSEQGIGDEFMFASMYAEMIDQAAHCLIECDHRIIPLLSRSFPSAGFIGTSTPPQLQTQSDDIDFQSAIGSLGRWLRPNEESFKRAKTSYFKADEARTRKFRERYTDNAVKVVVGVSWRTANPASSWQRNAEPTLWHKVFAQKGVRFVCLQYGDCTPALKNIHETTGVEIYQDAEVDPITDLGAFAAQIAAMDLVISIDNSTVHLAGALGKPVWTLLPFAPDWRWMLNRPDSPWYPSMRLFRQAAPGNWESMFDEVASELHELLAGAS